jgi:hypothetical protein
MALQDISLSISVGFNGNLALSYTVRNGSPSDVFLLDVGLYPQSNGDIIVGTVPPVATMVSGLLVLSLKLEQPPKGVLYSVPPRPYASKLRSGQTKTGTIIVPLPVRIRGEEFQPIETNRGQFVLGIVAESSDLQVEEQVIRGHTLWRLGTNARLYQREVVTMMMLPRPILVVGQK